LLQTVVHRRYKLRRAIVVTGVVTVAWTATGVE